MASTEPAYRLAATALGLAFALGCAGQSAREARAPARSDAPDAAGEPVALDRTVVTPHDAATLQELFDRAAERHGLGDAARAAREFDRVHELEPTGRLAADALLRAGVAYDDAADLDASVHRLEQLVRRHPGHAHVREALVRLVRLLAYLERWQRAGEHADGLMARYGDLRPFESVVAFGAKALALAASADAEAADRWIGKGLDVVEAHGLDLAGRVSTDLALLFFAQGEVRRIRGERIDFRPVPADFAVVLERRCQLLLDAQRSYSDVMRAYDAHWSAIAGYRVGELYQRLHADLMAVPAPTSANDERRRQLFEGAMRLRYAVLLEKGLAMMDHTVRMAKREGERSAWVQRAEDAQGALSRAQRDEQVALDRLPYSRAQLQEALDALAEKARAQGAGRP